MSSPTLFVRDSNRIEGIHRDPTQREIDAHQAILGLPELTVADLETFVDTVASAKLRRRVGMDVRVGPHVPPPGGPRVEARLAELLILIRDGSMTPWEAHVEYETLHPFTDGNGRSGRVLWAWQMRREGRDPFALPVLHAMYYQALECER